jgi:hypothetical protein
LGQSNKDEIFEKIAVSLNFIDKVNDSYVKSLADYEKKVFYDNNNIDIVDIDDVNTVDINNNNDNATNVDSVVVSQEMLDEFTNIIKERSINN